MDPTTRQQFLQVIRHVVADEKQYGKLLQRAWTAAIAKPRPVGKAGGHQRERKVGKVNNTERGSRLPVRLYVIAYFMG